MEGSQSPKVHGSWASVVQNKQVLKKYDINISTSEGQSSVEIPDEVFENATPLWEDFLVGNFLDTAPHVAKVHVILNKIWKQGTEVQQIDVYEVDSTTLRFRVRNPQVRARVLKRGMWNIAEVPMVVSKWSPSTERDQPEEKSIPLWVYLKKVPMNMFSWEGLSFITSAVGRPVRLHPETAACSNFDVAKIFVNADLSKELPKRICFSKNGTDFWVDFNYPWLPPRCSICEKWGHLDTRCVANMKISETLSQDNVQIPPNHDKAETTPTVNIGELSDMELAVLPETVAVQTETQGVTNLEGTLSANSVTIEEDSGQWSIISPSRARRSPQRSPSSIDSIVPIASASTFAVLSIPEEGEILEIENNAAEEDATDNAAGDQLQEEEVVKAKGVVDKGRPPLTRTSKKRMKDNVEASTHVTKDTIPVTSSKRFSRKNL